MDNINFATFDEANAAGYLSVPEVRAMGFKVRDTSGPNQFGYEFSVIDRTTDAVLAKTTEIHFSHERNKLGTLGCYAIRFRNSDIERLPG